MSVVTVLNRKITLQVLRRPTRDEWLELVHDVKADMIAFLEHDQCSVLTAAHRWKTGNP
jgi:hypothetical protein